uniref:Uncharacterized protein n=2 Tax=Caenorhabditis japonica TaxID=281687 RepID=A0A8R1EQQ0_CAEJA
MAIIRGRQMGLHMPTLAKQFKTSKSVIWATLNTPNQSKATGRPLKTSIGDDRIIVSMSKKNPRLTSTNINSELKDQYGVQDSVQGHCQKTSAPRETLQKAPRKQANDSGEEPFSSTEVGKGSSALEWNKRGLGSAEIARRLQISSSTVRILRRHFAGGPFILQQDWAPSHGSRSTLAVLEAHFPGFLDKNLWPASSPDLNPMDFSVWGMLEGKIAGKVFATVDDLKAALEVAWASIDDGYLRRTVNSVKKRLRACVKARGSNFEILLLFSKNPQIEKMGALSKRPILIGHPVYVQGHHGEGNDTIWKISDGSWVVVPTGQRSEAHFPLRQGLVRTASSERYELAKPISRPEFFRASLGATQGRMDQDPTSDPDEFDRVHAKRCEAVIKAKGMAIEY